MKTIQIVAAAVVAVASLAGAESALAQGTAACAPLETAAEGVLAAEATVQTASVGYVGFPDVDGCQINFAGTGTRFGTSFQAVAAKLDTMLTGSGWTRDPNADADGPTGTAGGYKKGSQLLFVSVTYDTAEGVCSANAPVASCHPTAAQMNYTITLGLRPVS